MALEQSMDQRTDRADFADRCGVQPERMLTCGQNMTAALAPAQLARCRMRVIALQPPGQQR